MEEQINIEEMENKIYKINGQYVMLDSDIANFCKVETKRINEAVRNNKSRFSEDNYFQITEIEYSDVLRSKISTLESGKGKHRKYLPYVFTEEGIEILSTILKSKIDSSKLKVIKEIFQKANTKYTLIVQGKPESIEKIIYDIDGKQVMLDYDLGVLYRVGTKRINEAVRNNLEKFPERFSWKLTEREYENLRSKFSTSSLKEHGGRRYLPRVFTEQGVAMLATVLKSSVATQVSIAIMDAFVTMRHYLLEYKDIYYSLNTINNRLDRIDQKLLLHDNKFAELFSKFDKQSDKEWMYFDGQVYDAYSKLIDIMRAAKKELIIVDGYADKTFLDIVANIKVKVILITKKKSRLKALDIEKYTKQYDNLTIIYNESFHDRYIVLDKEIVYHCGASINHAGSKTFSIHKLEDKEIVESFLHKIESMQ